MLGGRTQNLYTKLGLIADVQYANVPESWDFSKTVKRRYRYALVALRRAVDLWNSQNADIVVNLGDLIDARNLDEPTGSTDALNSVMSEFARLSPSIKNTYHLIGNHDLNNFTRNQLVNGVGNFRCADGAGRTFFQFPINRRWRGVVLDGYEESLLSIGGGRVGNELTLANGGIDRNHFNQCQTNNPNDLSIYNSDFFAGLTAGPDMRWVSFNGAVSEAQLAWLENILVEACAQDVKICIFSHLIAHPETSPGCRTLFWNYDRVLATLRKYSSACLFICGHAHKERYFQDQHTHHLTLPSPLEVQTDDCCAVLVLGEDGSARMSGFGMADRVFIES